MALISAETGTLAFAVINLALVIGSSLFGVGLLIFWGFSAFSYLPGEDVNPSGVVIALMVSISLLFLSLVSLVFSSFLMNGILKKKPEHIKVYYIFGIVKLVLGLSGFITLFTDGVNIDPAFYIIVLVVYTLYGLILTMIRYTYLKLEINQNQYGHQRLNEKC